MKSTGYDPSDTIADGLAVFAVATNDHAATESGVAAYRLFSRKIRGLMRPGDNCRLALSSAIIRPHLRTTCFVIVLQNRVLIVYQQGFLRKTPQALVIPIATVADVCQHIGSARGARGVALLTISGTPSATIALPTNTATAAAAAIREALTSPTS